MLCPRCQTECAEENNFCHKCGADLHEKKVHDNLSLKLPSAHAENKKSDIFLPIQPSLTKEKTVKSERRPISLRKSPEMQQNAGGVDLSKTAETVGGSQVCLNSDGAGPGRAEEEPNQAAAGPSPAEESFNRDGGLELNSDKAEQSQSVKDAVKTEAGAERAGFSFSPFASAEQRVSLHKESAGNPSGSEHADAAETGKGGAETGGTAASFGFAADAEKNEGAGEIIASVSPQSGSEAAGEASGGEEIFVGIPQRVSVFSGHGGREGSALNTQELVDKTLAGWNSFDVQPIPAEKRDEHVGLRAEGAAEKSPFASAVQPAAKPEPEAAKPASNATRVLKADSGEEVGSVNTDFRTVRNVFSNSTPTDPTSEAFSQREHAKAIINEVPRAGGKGNDSASAGKVGIVIASCGCLVLFALVSFSLFIYFFFL